MKITYYSKYSNLGPSSRYRAFQYTELFRSAGFDFRISELFGDEYFDIIRTPEPQRSMRKVSYTLSRFNHRKKILRNDKSDLAIIEHQLFPYLPFAIEKRYLPSRFLFEFDDAIYLTHRDKIPLMIQSADGVIAGNEALADFARRFNQNVHIVPTVLNTDVFQPRSKTPHSKLVLGWSGLEYNFQYLKTLSPVFKRVIQNFPVEVVILAVTSPRDFDFPFRFEKWDPAREVEQLNEFDVGVMPLRMDEWSQGKCGLKLLQYMSLAIPSIATPIGVNRQIIRHGENGLLATELSEWETHLTQLILDPGLRSRMGKAARSTVLAEYSTDVWFPRLASIYSSFVNR